MVFVCSRQQQQSKAKLSPVINSILRVKSQLFYSSFLPFASKWFGIRTSASESLTSASISSRQDLSLLI